MFDLISAVLAFAITMFFLSTVAATLMETIHRFLRQREKGLELMLGHFYDRVLAAATGEDAENLRRKFLDLMTVNRAPAGAGLQGDSDFSENSRDEDRWTWLWNGRRLASLPLDDFMNRLGSSPFGDLLRAKLAGATEETRQRVLADIATKFDTFGADASVYFQSRARFFCVLLSIGLAYFIHIHPLELFSAYLRTEGLSENVIGIHVTETSALKNAEQPPEQALKDAGVPLGWTAERKSAAGFWIWDTLGVPVPVPCSAVPHESCKNPDSKQFPTLVWLIIGGLLVGLGAPFWKSVIDQLTPMRAKAKDAETALGDGADRLKTAVERFETAAANRAALG